MSIDIENPGADSAELIAALRSLVGAEYLIEEISPTGTGTVTFNNIPQTFNHLHVIGYGRSSTSGAGANLVQMRCNNDSGTNYGVRRMIAAASFIGPGSSGDTYCLAGEFSKAGVIADLQSFIDIRLLGYRETTFAKTFDGSYQLFPDATISAPSHYTLAGHWRNTAAISRLDFILDAGNYVAGTKFRLYGRM